MFTGWQFFFRFVTSTIFYNIVDCEYYPEYCKDYECNKQYWIVCEKLYYRVCVHCVQPFENLPVWYFVCCVKKTYHSLDYYLQGIDFFILGDYN